MNNSESLLESPSRSLIDSLAETTSYRDRDSLNTAVTQLLVEFLTLQSATLYRIINDHGADKLLRLASAELESAGNVQSAALTALPDLADLPAWKECVVRRESAQYRSPAGNFIHLFPVESGRDLLGLLVIQTLSALQERDISLVRSVLRILRNHVELLDYGERDTLTQLLNRKTFESRFGKLRARLASRSGRDGKQESWLAVLDIDKFKSINDAYGHLFGDEVLLLLSQLMQQCFRGADQLFRFGGEEFVIVLDDATDAGAQIAYERMRLAAATFNFPQVGRVTVSIGYSRIREDDGPASSIERADAALYYAKRHGRDQVCNFEALVGNGALRAKTAGGDAELF